MGKQGVRAFFVLSAALVCWLAATPVDFTRRAGAQATEPPVVSLAPHVGGLAQPVGVTHAGDGSGRLFIIEQGGRVRIFKNGALLATPFLDISNRISSGGEQGLLGLAFPPGFASKGYFYVNYTLPNAPGDAGDTVIARFNVSAMNPDLADPASEQRILVVPQPFQNHNGGHLAFGPRDGLLYAALGDGGSGGDPGNRAQNPAELLGKVLRLDVETGRPFTYTVPPSNPFAGRAGFRPEIWASGLRNPWRFSFDRSTGDLFIGDVGQNNFEEIDFQPAASRGGENYGWRIMEGLHCFNPNPCAVAGLTLPVWEYTHAEGCSVTGGYVYRGGFPRMRGIYFYGDYCSGRIWGLRRSGSGWQNTLLLDTSINISSFGEDEAGNLYVASHNTGQVFMLVDDAPPPAPIPPPLAEVRFASSGFNVREQDGFGDITVTRSGNTAAEFTVDYRTTDGTASERSDYTSVRGTLRFAPNELQKSIRVLVTDDDTREGNEALTVVLENPSALATITQPTAAVNLLDDDAATDAANPIDRSDFFVRQHYFDFLSRFPDAAGEAFWAANIENCGASAPCREARRVDTSAAFFLSIEFQETGYFVYRVHKAAFGDLPGRPVPIRRESFLPDTQAVGRGVVVGVGDWEAALEANKRAYLNEFVTRDAFVERYPTGQTPAAYVDALDRNAGNVLTPAARADLVARLADGRETRATALRRVAENATLRAAQFNKAFVLMEYFGYLRRNPDDPPDANFDGWRFWLAKLEDNGGDFRRAEMVRAFIVSIEYRRRFRQ
ncbi:MAG: PQQ-dependent sugar dehydrogenase [Acidobacteriota bacterium]|nr:PQQ-dependent sugar dehydrogenase [Acidobacteriota bacterium]